MAAVIVLIASILFPSMGVAAGEQETDGPQKINEVFGLLSEYHVSGAGEEALSEAAIKGMIEALNDPYTQYMTEAEWQQFMSVLERNYVGIGARLFQTEDGVRIIEIFPDSPADAAGLLAGDVIVKVNGKAVQGRNLDEIISSIVGAEGTTVRITVRRGTKELLYSIVRRKIKIPTVTATRLDEKIGYVRLSSFSSDTDEIFAQELKNLREQGIVSLIVDLRDNPGGLLETAENIAKLFIREGTLIHTQDRHAQDHPIVITNGQTFPYPVYVLVNEGSASASEVLAGALQDYNLATLIGTKTYGKGSVQSLFPLSSGGALKVTVQHYFTPTMRPVDGVGLIPDQETPGEAAQMAAALQMAGAERISLKVNDSGVLVNGLSMIYPLQIIRDQAAVFVPVRLLAALVGAQVEWSAAERSAIIKYGDMKASYPLNSSDVRYRQGTIYVDLSVFTMTFPQFSWNVDGNDVNLNVIKEKQAWAK